MAPVAVLLSLLTNCVYYSNADWTYGYSSTERTSIASRTPESQWCTSSPPPTRLRWQIVAYPADTGSNLCLIAANRTPCRRNPRTRLQSHTHGLAGCYLNSLRIRVEARANVTERAVISRQLQLIQASVQSHPTEDLNTADTSCPSRTSAEHFDDGTGPCQENWTLACLYQCGWASNQCQLDRIEYNWLQRTHLLTDSLCTAPECRLPSSPCNSIRAGCPRW